MVERMDVSWKEDPCFLVDRYTTAYSFSNYDRPWQLYGRLRTNSHLRRIKMRWENIRFKELNE